MKTNEEKMWKVNMTREDKLSEIKKKSQNYTPKHDGEKNIE